MTNRRLEIDIDEATESGLQRLSESRGLPIEAIVRTVLVEALESERSRRESIIALGREIAQRDAAILDALAKA